MRTQTPKSNTRCCAAVAAVAWSFLFFPTDANGWWNKDWTIRKKITIDTSAQGVPIAEPIGGTAVLVRLFDGNFQFIGAREDGSDLRFIAEDDKTQLTYHIERYDGLLAEAFVWVRVPEIKSEGETSFWLYYGNLAAEVEKVEDAKGTYDAETALVYHLSQAGAPPADATEPAENAENAGLAAQGSMIGGGLRLDGKTFVTIPAAPTLTWTEGAAMTWSAWVKPAVLQPNAIVFSRREGANAFVVGMDNGVPFVEVTGAAGTQRTPAGTPTAANSWKHLAVVSAGANVTFFIDGEQAGVLNIPLPALNSPMLIGGDGTGLVGEFDELKISRVARSPGSIKLAAFGQGGEKAQKLLTFAQEEQKTGWFSGGGTMSVLVGSLTVDGWIVIVILAFMGAGSWWLMFTKIRYLNSISKGNALFMQQWKRIASDLTALDEGDAEHFRTMGGRLDKAAERAMRSASVYRIYHIGVEEIRHRLAEDNAAEGERKGLAGRSIQAIRASLDGGLVRESQKLNRLVVLLTICISGGPFLGLLGTVVGVMITFAAIAAAGDVNVNAIAPGIAAALLATVAGLAVAIPALFGYNYIISRVKDAKDDMAIFIDEFVTKMAEFYRETPPPAYSARPQFFQEQPALAESRH